MFRALTGLIILGALFALLCVPGIEGGCGDCYKEYSATSESTDSMCPEDSPLINDAETCDCSSSSSGGSSSGGGGGGWTLSNRNLRQPDWRQRMADKYYSEKNRQAIMAEDYHRRLTTCAESSCCETQAERDKREEETTIGIAVGVSCGAIVFLGLGYFFFFKGSSETAVVQAVPMSEIAATKKARAR